MKSPSPTPTLNPADHRLPEKTEFYVVGSNLFNNEMLSSYLSSQTGRPCHCVQPSDIADLYDDLLAKQSLIILDCTAMGQPKSCDGPQLKRILKDQHFKVVCCNVDPDAKLETSALRKGVRGILYNNVPINQYPRAMNCILRGQLWYQRSVLEKFFLEANTIEFPTNDRTAILTKREKEILIKLVSGLRNEDIARELCISPHTVKTHAYNIYKKINVTSRLQAARWLSDRMTGS